VKRDNAREIETPFGTFYGGIFEANGEHGPTFYAETESGDVTINGVTYRGSVYAERYSHNGELYLSVRHLTRWDDKRGHFYPASESAGRKLAAALLPAFREWSQDADYVTSRKIMSLTSSHRYAIEHANREIEKANELAAQIRELGGECADIPLVVAS
jgi:hypothetical protein